MRVAHRSALILFLAALAPAARGQTSPLLCNIVATVPPQVRAEGLAELLGDVVIQCNGGVPTPAGQPLPEFSFSLLLNTNLTSAPTAMNQFDEALLLVDEPASASNPSRPILNCGNVGAPDSGSAGPGVCSILSTGSPASNYDGTPNGFGIAVCDGASGRPTANNYGCGRPNAFQGRLGTPSGPGQLNAVTFYNVPFDPPGAGAQRTFRVTNLRANASSLGVAAGNYPSTVQVAVSITGLMPVSLANANQTLALVFSGLVFNPTTCTPSAPLRVKICEGFASSWKHRNVSFAVGNGAIAGNASLPSGGAYWAYDGGTHYPADVAQNVPGAIYQTESGFQWQNNGVNAPPTPNPPYGTGTSPVTTRSSPFNSVGYGGLNTGINTDGVAASGTRFAIRFNGLPAGASIQVPQIVNLTNGVTSATGVMVLTNTDAAGAGPFSAAASGILPGNLAVYEILWADPFSVESAEIAYTLLGAPPGTTAQVSAGFAPFSSDSGSQQASSGYPVPRFLDSSNVCGGQSCLTASPDQASNTGSIQVRFTNNGSQGLVGAQVLLRGSGVPDILGLDTSNAWSNILYATFDLAGAPAGPRDIVVTPVSGPPITFPGGFSILQIPSCAWSVGPQSASFPASGGSGALIVSPSATQCGWSASAGAQWITLSPVSANLPMAQPFTVSANTSSTARSATIAIAGENIAVTQEGSGTCDYTISPGSTVFPVAGGIFTVNVTAQPGCAWAASNTLSWVSFAGASSGSGNGSLTIQTGANSGNLLSGTVTIAGQPFQVRQSASGCGATDVTSQISVKIRALLQTDYYYRPYTQQLTFTNQGSAVVGPVYVVLDGLCAYTLWLCPGSSLFTTCGLPPYTSSPMVPVTSSGLAVGQTVNLTLDFGYIPYVSPFGAPWATVPEASVSMRVFSGTPGH